MDGDDEEDTAQGAEVVENDGEVLSTAESLTQVTSLAQSVPTTAVRTAAPPALDWSHEPLNRYR